MGDGAFSNVYKAVERKTGQKCAVKVVRKYELNYSQVRTSFIHPLHSPYCTETSPLTHLPYAGHVRGEGGQGDCSSFPV